MMKYVLNVSLFNMIEEITPVDSRRDIKHLAFLIDCPGQGQVMMFPEFYENMWEHINEHYEELDINLVQFQFSWIAKLKGHKYKIFKTKVKPA